MYEIAPRSRRPRAPQQRAAADWWAGASSRGACASRLRQTLHKVLYTKVRCTTLCTCLGRRAPLLQAPQRSTPWRDVPAPVCCGHLAADIAIQRPPVALPRSSARIQRMRPLRSCPLRGRAQTRRRQTPSSTAPPPRRAPRHWPPTPTLTRTHHGRPRPHSLTPRRCPHRPCRPASGHRSSNHIRPH